MKLMTSTNIYFERTNEDLIPVDECFKYCAEVGYRELDFGFVEFAMVSEQFQTEEWKHELAQLELLSQSLGLKISQAHATIFDFCIQPENQVQESLFKRSIEGAKLLGARWIVVHPSTGISNGEFDPTTHEKNVAFFQRYAEFAAQIGIGIAIENMWGTTKELIPRYAIHPEELLQLLEDINCDNVRLCWDVEHASLENISNRRAIILLKDYLVATHISDELGPNNIHTLPYLGKVDWEEILDVLAEIRYEGTFDFEIQHYLRSVPKDLILPAMKLSYQVGQFMIRRFNFLSGRQEP